MESKIVKVGIFWAIPVMGNNSERRLLEVNKRFYVSEADANGFINYPYSHYEAWDDMGCGFGSDCYRYPRGRVIYDANRGKHKIFADKCVDSAVIDEIVELYDIDSYELCRDEHYVCPSCVKRIAEKAQNTPPALEYKVLRGADKIGENLIEISYGNTCVLVELGRALNAAGNEELSELEQTVIKKRYSAVIVSHYHEDHAGLIEYKRDCSVYIGAGAARVLQATYCYRGKAYPQNIKPYRDGKPFKVGNIKITPYLCDHSAYDSYMLLFEAGGQSILYTGDFRFHGRKDKERLLSRLPRTVDVLIHEGTNIGSRAEVISETELENRAVEIMRSTNKPIFVLQSSSNIDRLVGIYRASKRSGRIFYMDNYTALITSAIGGRVPRPDVFHDVYAFTPRLLRGARKDMFWEIENKRGIKQIADCGKPFTMLVRPSMTAYMEKLAKKLSLSGATLIYSMWSGYKARDDVKKFLNTVTDMDINTIDLHTSGHAAAADIDLLKRTVCAKTEVCVHTNTK